MSYSKSRTVLQIGILAVLMLALAATMAQAETGPSVKLWPNANTTAHGDWSKLAGTVMDAEDEPVTGQTVYLQYWNGSAWEWFKTVTTTGSGYFQAWFPNVNGTRTFRAKEAAQDMVSNTAEIVVTEKIAIWNNVRPTIHYCEWTKIHGLYGGPSGPSKGATLYLQKKVGDDWAWVETLTTDENGYYVAWTYVCSDTDFRVATEGSVLTSAEITKVGSRIIPWSNSRIHGVLRDGFGDGMWGINLYLQKWNGSEWVWQASCITTSSGYCNFGANVPSGTLRIGTWGSRVVSQAFNN